MAFLLLLLLAWSAQAVRVFIVERTYGEASGCDGCLALGVLGSDAGFWLVWLALAWAGFALQQVWLARLLRVACALLLVYYALDIYVMTQFNSRMYVAWITIVGSTPGPVVDHLAATVPWWRWGAVLGALAALFLVAWRQPDGKPGRGGYGLLALSAAACVLAVWISRPVYYVHGWVVDNVFDQTGARTFAQPYGEATLDRLPKAGDVAAECRGFSGESRARDLVVLMLESWSPYQSELMTGLEAWTPGLDRLMRDHGHFERMMSSGFGTNHALIALLSGIPPLATLVPPLERKPFQPAWGWDETFPKQLNEAGYDTAFLTNGNLAFTNKGEWLTHIGFEYVEGHDHPFYDGMPRLHFQAAPDAALYDRAADFLAERKEIDPPLALVVESVSSHSPFIDPETGKRDEEAVFRYMDRTAADFIESMLDDGFVERGGILVVVSDHRAMKAISPEELEALGGDAHARIPMMVLANDIPPVDRSGLWTQTDLPPSLIALTTGSACGYPGWRNLFAPPAESRCVFHTRGDDRNLTEAYCTDGRGTIRLAGDDSRFISADGLSPERQQDLLLEVARLRLIADEHNERFFGSE